MCLVIWLPELRSLPYGKHQITPHALVHADALLLILYTEWACATQQIQPSLRPIQCVGY